MPIQLDQVVYSLLIAVPIGLVVAGAVALLRRWIMPNFTKEHAHTVEVGKRFIFMIGMILFTGLAVFDYWDGQSSMFGRLYIALALFNTTLLLTQSRSANRELRA